VILIGKYQEEQVLYRVHRGKLNRSVHALMQKTRMILNGAVKQAKKSSSIYHALLKMRSWSSGGAFSKSLMMCTWQISLQPGIDIF
jgi:hypothetical protein